MHHIESEDDQKILLEEYNCNLELDSARDRETHRLTAEHLLAEEKADKIARDKGGEVLEETDEDNSTWSYLDQDSGMC